MFYYISRTICLLFFKILFGYTSYGKVNLPVAGPYIIASNHVSFLDPVAAGLIVNRKIAFIARKDLFKNKFFGLILRMLGVIPLDRDKPDIKAIRKAIEVLKQNKILVIFPEGKRSRDGRLGEPLPGLEILAKRTDVKVVPVYLDGTNFALPMNAYFIRLKKIRVFVGRAIEPNYAKTEALNKTIWEEMHRLRDRAKKFECRISKFHHKDWRTR